MTTRCEQTALTSDSKCFDGDRTAIGDQGASSASEALWISACEVPVFAPFLDGVLIGLEVESVDDAVGDGTDLCRLKS